MPFTPKTSPVIRATLAANDAVDRLHTVRLAEAKDDVERERITRQHRDLIMTLMAILHEAQFGPTPPIPNGPRLLARATGAIAPRAGEKTAPTPRPAADAVYQLKITLRGSTPPVWRRLQVRGNTALSRLHAILQIAMGWTDSHLHEFVVRDVRYGSPEMEWDPLDRPRDERRVRLGQLMTRENDRLSYEYDFGDGWAHDITVEKILPPEPGIAYPRCLAGKRSCPPEDVGGLSSYADFRAAIRDPLHAEHTELLAWAGGVFDPEAFDLNAINARLRSVGATH